MPSDVSRGGPHSRARSLAAVVASGLCLCLTAACGAPEESPSQSRKTGAASTVYATSGARIYYTATSENGTRLSVAPSFGEPPQPATRSCADCHGADGAGGVLETPDGFRQTPPIAFSRLASPSTYREGRTYDEATLALTLRTGVRIDGYLLDTLMPRWQMSPQEMQELIAHLKTLDPGGGPTGGR